MIYQAFRRFANGNRNRLAKWRLRPNRGETLAEVVNYWGVHNRLRLDFPVERSYGIRRTAENTVPVGRLSRAVRGRIARDRRAVVRVNDLPVVYTNSGKTWNLPISSSAEPANIICKTSNANFRAISVSS